MPGGSFFLSLKMLFICLYFCTSNSKKNSSSSPLQKDLSQCLSLLSPLSSFEGGGFELDPNPPSLSPIKMPFDIGLDVVVVEVVVNKIGSGVQI